MYELIKSKAREIEGKMIERRRDIHKHAEAGWTEFRTASIAIKALQELGYKITMGDDAVKRSEMMGVPPSEELKKHELRAISQGADAELVKKMSGGLTGFIAEIQFSEDGPKIGFRVDMDSNDVYESKDSNHRPYTDGFASVNEGAMHACGHDAHVAIGLAVAEVIVGMKDKLRGSIRLIFQPAEEGLRGARPMVSAGVTEGLNIILGMHVGFQADKKGKLICGAKGFLASTKWDITINGKGAHAGASPQEGRNALLAASVASINLHAISRHGDGVTRINVGKLIAGEGRNVIPPNALLIMETRGGTSELNNYMVNESERIIKSACDMYGCTYSIEVTGGTESGESSPEMIDIVFETAKDIPYYSEVIRLKDFGAGEDYAHMMSDVQKNGGIGTYIQVGIDKTAGHHNNMFDIDESGLLPAVELMSSVITKVLMK